MAELQQLAKSKSNGEPVIWESHRNHDFPEGYHGYSDKIFGQEHKLRFFLLVIASHLGLLSIFILDLCRQVKFWNTRSDDS
jgi:hypothetical protein